MSATLAFALYGLLVDAAVETWWSGSPVRWWVVAAVAADAVAAALLWRRVTWRSQATISAFVFLGVVAITAWMPGGLTTGVRLAGHPTSTLLSLLIAAAVALAASVVWRFRAVPLAVRTGVGLLAAYGLAALAYGVVTDVPFPALFSGDSAWQRLPAFLQGACVGGLIVLPLAFLISVVRAGIPRFREGSPRYALYQIVALGTSLAIVLAALPLAGDRGNRPGANATTAGFNVPAPAAIVPSAARSDALDNSLRAVEDGERESPRDRWDPAYVVEQVGKDPQQLFDWVTGHTNWIPYRGLLRGPVGVLMDRMGSSLDRAVLLATLLRTAGHSVRLAHGELAADRAMGLLPALIVARSGDTARERRPTPSDAGDVKQIAAQYSLNGPAVAQAVSSSAFDGERVFSSLDARVADQTARLRAAVGKRLTADDLSARLDSASTLLRDHWWVQRQDGASWVDLDLLSPDMTALTTAQETVALDALAPSQVHQVIVRVVAEQWHEGKVSERVALQHTLLPAELIGKPITLRLWPRRWPATVNPGPNPSQFLRTTALAQHEWLASLQIGRDVAAQSSLREDGEINDHPALNDFANIGDRTGGAADNVASMLRGLAPDPAATPARQAMLTAAWFEFEIRAPGEPPRTTRRAVFDLLGPAARASVPVPQIALDDDRSLARSLSLMMETEILPVACRLAPEFFRHLVGESLLGNRDVLRALVRGEISDTTTKPEELASRLMPIPGPLYPLALARFDRSRFGDQIYLVAPNLLTRHVFFAPRGGARIALWDATDIVANEVGVDLRVKDAFAVRFEQGVLDTNAEAHLQRGAAVVGSPANAFAASKDWVTLASASDPQLAGLRLSDDDRRSIARDLAGGSVVVAPRGPVRVGSEDFVGWWRIDPARGDVLGVDRRGWGQAAGEYMMLVTAAMTGFYVTWLMCRVPPPSAPGAAVASGYVPGLDQLVAPLAAAGDACIAAAIDGAILGAILGLMSMSSGGGASGAGGGKGGAGGGTGGGGGGTGKGGGGTGSGGGGTGSGGGGTGSGGGPAGAGAGGRGGTQPMNNAGGGGGGPAGAGAGGRGGTQPMNSAAGEGGGPAGAGGGGRGGTQPMKTEVPANQEADYANTGAGEQAAPRTGLATAREVADAKNAFDAAQAESTQATKDYVNYRALKPNPGRDVPGDPSYNPTVDEALQNDMMQKAAARNDALQKLEQTQAGLPQGIPAGKGGGFPPPRPAPQPPDVFGCPPNCGNDNKTGPAQNVQVPGQNKNVVGVAGVSNVLSGK